MNGVGVEAARNIRSAIWTWIVNPQGETVAGLPGSLNLLQSRGGSLHLLLLQNGACPFPSTPLLSVLMLVTHTVREIVPMLPRLRLGAVSVQRLQIRRAAIAAIAIDMIDFNPIVVVGTGSV